MSFIIRAIDVGYGNTKYVTNVDGDKIDCSHFPSQTFYSASEPVQNGLGGARKTIAVPINGNYYEVGPDVELAAHWLRSRQRHDGYTETEEYRALMAGALHFMKAEVVDLLVLGLPVAHYMTKRQQLAKSMTGIFELGKKRQVEVKRVVVVAQQQRRSTRGIRRGTDLGAPSCPKDESGSGADFFPRLMVRAMLLAGALTS